MKIKFALFFLGCLALSASIFLYLHYRVTPGLDLSKIQLNDTNGQMLKAAQLAKGNGMVIQFFASWCPDCRKELPEFALASKQLKSRQVLCYAFTDESLAEIDAYLQQFEESSIQFFQLAQPLKRHGIHAVPTTYFLKPDGSTIYSKVGRLDWRDITNILRHFGL